MILDQLADLKSLALSASSATVTLTEDAAFAEVQRQVDTARLLWVGLGVAQCRALELLTQTERRAVIESAAHMKKVLEVIAGASDQELAMYAATTVENRGTLSAVLRQARVLRETLLSAQKELLRSLAERIWPEADLLQLDLIGHLTDDPVAAEMANRAADIRQRVMAVIGYYDPGVPRSELDSLIEAATAVAVEAQSLRTESIDDEVLSFWKAAESVEGAPLALLTEGVRNWIDKHGASGSFKVQRTR